VADYTVANYAALRATAGSGGETAEVTATRYAGTFNWAASGADNGATIISDGAGGAWVRDWTHGASTPYDLGWDEDIVNNYNITSKLASLASTYAPSLYVKVPEEEMTLQCDRINWGLGQNGVTTLHFLESNQPVTVQMTGTDDVLWRMYDMLEIVTGSTSAKTQDTCNLTFRGTYSLTNKGNGDDVFFPNYNDNDGTGLIRTDFYVASATRRYFYFRHNTQYPRDKAFRTYFWDVNVPYDVTISGKHQHGGGAQISGGRGYDANIHFEDAYFSDEFGRGAGWDYSSSGALTLANSKGRDANIGSTTGFPKSFYTKVTGEITLQYGALGSNWFFVDQFGNGVDDPFIINKKDWMWTGPNDFGDSGVSLDYPPYKLQTVKSDGLGIQGGTTNRNIKIVETNQLGAWTETNQYSLVYFAENEAADDSGGAKVYTQYVTWTYVGVSGTHEIQNGTSLGEVFADNIIQGDGVNIAQVAGQSGSGSGFRWRIDLGDRDTLRYGQFHDVRMGDYDPDPLGTNQPFTDGVIHDVSLTGWIWLDYSGNTCTATNVRFLGSARQVVRLDGGTTLTMTNVHVPADTGYTAEGSGTLIVNGQTKTLPYTFTSTDATGAQPAEVPPNPTLSSSPTPEPVVGRSVRAGLRTGIRRGIR
jgi:hypothetical protein